MLNKKPIEGDIKVEEKYLYFPLILKNEFKWFVTAIIEYKFIKKRWVATEFLYDDDL